MEGLCKTCVKHLSGDDKKDLHCKKLQGFCRRYITSGKVYFCYDYKNAAEVEVEDDGTQRCNICGALWMGWDVCLNCGAKFDACHGAEVTHIITVEITEIERGAKCEDDDDWKRARAERIEAVMRRAFPEADDIKVAKVQEFVKEGEDDNI